MKMICPHCGVKGSADDVLLGKKVKCPKCVGVFEVGAEVVEAIEVDELELEQLPDSVDGHVESTSEQEIDDVFSKLLAGEASTDETVQDIDNFADDSEESDSEHQASAVLSDSQVASEPFDEERQDETLTVIEDFPEDVMLGSDEAESYVSEDDEEITAALEGLEETAQRDVSDEIIEEAAEDDETLDFDGGIFADGSDNQADESEDAGNLPKELFADEPEVVAEDQDAEEGSAEEELRETGSEELADDNENILSASFTDGNLDESFEQEDDETHVNPSVRKCSACDQYVDPEHKYEADGNVYCSKCIPAGAKVPMDDEIFSADGERAFPGLSKSAGLDENDMADSGVAGAVGRFTVTTLIKDAYHYSKGVKGSIWAGITLMHILLIGIAVAVFAAFFSIQMMTAVEPLTAKLIEGGVQALFSVFSFIFSAGILMIAVNRVGQQYFSWKMVFSGFKRFGSMLGLFILQTIMLIIGYCLFILPGIYLSIGYILSVPLVFLKGLSPWQALETSRQAVHTRWWTVFFAFIVMGFLTFLSAIPLGLGLIWTVPMLVVMIGVLYYHLFGADEVDEEEEEFEETVLAE